jgi:hypothetical protein
MNIFPSTKWTIRDSLPWKSILKHWTTITYPKLHMKQNNNNFNLTTFNTNGNACMFK